MNTASGEGPNGDELPTADGLIEWIQGLKGDTPVQPWVLDLIKILQENEPDCEGPKRKIRARL